MSGDVAIGGWDVHAHLVPDGVVAAARDARFGMGAENGKLQVCGHGVPLVPISQADKLIERLETDGLDGAVVSVPPPLFRPDLEAAARAGYADFVNEALLEACADYPAQLRPLAYLPAEDPELAADRAEGLDARWAGVVFGTELAGLSFADPRYQPLWKTLVRRDLPAFLHPGSSPDPRLKRFYLGNLLGNPVETGLAAADMIFGDVFAHAPGLKIILAHGGGVSAALSGRWQRGVDTDRPGVPKTLSLEPRRALKQFYLDTIVHDPAYLKFLIEIVGPDRLVYGSDWPFPMGSGSADEALGMLDAETRRAIRCDNSSAVFGERLSVPPAGSV